MKESDLTSARSPRIGRRGAGAALLLMLTLVSTASAHDFWIIPDVFVAGADSTIHASGRAGTRFATGTAVQPARVADARLIGATSSTRITQLTVEGTSLRLHQRSLGEGQYVIAVTLTSNPTRSTAAGMVRFLKAEGGTFEADRLERQNALAGQDSLVYHSTAYATAVLEVGRGGPRAFAISTGLPLEFIPLNDPGHLHVGDTLHVKVVGAGTPVPNIGVYAGAAVDTTAAASAPGSAANSLSITADANGIVHLPLTTAAAWNLRAAHVYRAAGAPANEWRIARTTNVFREGDAH